jgi:hypothetical protein
MTASGEAERAFGAMTAGPAALMTFADLHAAIKAEFAGADPVSLRDLILLRYAAEVALQAGDFAEMAKVHRQIMRKESEVRAALRCQRGDGLGRASSLRARLEQKYAGGGRAS